MIDETAAALATIPGGAVLDTVNQVFMVRSCWQDDVITLLYTGREYSNQSCICLVYRVRLTSRQKPNDC